MASARIAAAEAVAPLGKQTVQMIEFLDEKST
jgi:hypothetical protein